jgi:hypothetical protein
MMGKLFVSILLVFSLAITAQEKDAFLPKANEEFAAKNYADAEANYRISHSKFREFHLPSKSIFGIQNSICECVKNYQNTSSKAQSFS